MRYKAKTITKHELLLAKHYCWNYPQLTEKRTSLYYAIKSPTFNNTATPTSQEHSFVEDCAIKAEKLSKHIELIEKATAMAVKKDPVLYPYILQGVTDEHATYDFLANKGLPCCRNTYYTIVRRVYTNIINSII